MALVNRPSGFLNAIYTVSQALSLVQVSSESPATNNYSDVLAEEMRGKKGTLGEDSSLPCIEWRLFKRLVWARCCVLNLLANLPSRGEKEKAFLEEGAWLNYQQYSECVWS